MPKYQVTTGFGSIQIIITTKEKSKKKAKEHIISKFTQLINHIIHKPEKDTYDPQETLNIDWNRQDFFNNIKKTKIKPTPIKTT